ncbi:extensin-like [Lathyrus oleraceus]|uniref:extensin-like n=1 Tax=Pisum sativum TaxID=3888 RepID=UPI0021D3B19C|nr:extensin-like [Pisum sativum]
MDAQQQSVYNYSQQIESTDQTSISNQQTDATTGVVSTPIYREPHILDREPYIHLATPFEKLELPERPPNFMKRQREPYGKSKKAKKAKLGETSGSRPPVPLADSPKVTSPPSEQQNTPPSDQPQTPPPEQQTNPPYEQPQTPPPEQPSPSPSEHQPSPPPEQTTPPPSDIPPLPTSEAIITPTQNPADTNPTPPSSSSSNPEP